MSDTKIQWHPGFVAAMSLELRGYRDDLDFEKEYNLNTKPLEIDLLIIKKEASVHIDNDIGSLFRGHNILEYKSPEDHLDIDTFSKALAYAYLYKAYGNKLDEIRMDDMTVSIIREARPVGLFRYFKEHGYAVSREHDGIYHIEGSFPFPAQVIVTGEMDRTSHIWLKALSGKLNKEDLQDLLDRISQITEKNDREMADSVLEVSIGANRQIVEELMEDESMFETLMEIMEPRINEIKINSRMEGREEGREEGIRGTIDVLKKLNYGREEIISMITEQYGITEDEATDFLKS